MKPEAGGVIRRRWNMSPVRFSRKMFSLMGVFLLLAWGASPAFGGEASASGVLDGKTFLVEQGEKGEKAKGTDTLIFRNGRFRSTGCDKYGFGDGAYTTTVEGDAVRFVADTTSDTKGKMHWEGTVREDKIDVTYIWTDRSHWYKPNPKPLEKWAKGELKKSK
jgi:hypothetical protein